MYKMFNENMIEPAQTEWDSPIVFASKKDDTFCFCVDSLKSNVVAKRDSYQKPQTDKCIDSLGVATALSTLDAKSGYWQIEIDEADRDKIALTFHQGLYRFIQMPFGLRNAPGTFQQTKDVILSAVKWQSALVYTDDIAVFLKSLEKHMVHVSNVLKLISDADVTLKLKKCRFFAKNIDYLEHVIRQRRLEITSHTTDAIRKLQLPTFLTKIGFFHGVCNVF